MRPLRLAPPAREWCRKSPGYRRLVLRVLSFQSGCSVRCFCTICLNLHSALCCYRLPIQARTKCFGWLLGWLRGLCGMRPQNSSSATNCFMAQTRPTISWECMQTALGLYCGAWSQLGKRFTFGWTSSRFHFPWRLPAHLRQGFSQVPLFVLWFGLFRNSEFALPQPRFLYAPFEFICYIFNSVPGGVGRRRAASRAPSRGRERG